MSRAPIELRIAALESQLAHVNGDDSAKDAASRAHAQLVDIMRAAGATPQSIGVTETGRLQFPAGARKR